MRKKAAKALDVNICGEFLDAGLTRACGRFRRRRPLWVCLLVGVSVGWDVWTGDDRRALLVHILVRLALLGLSPPLQPDGTEDGGEGFVSSFVG